jgi:hypothetical protein
VSELPSDDVLARLVSGVTETMFGMSFNLTPDNQTPRWEKKLTWRTAVLPISGGRPLTVAVASDPHGGKLLAGEMFAVAEGEVDPSMIDDSLSELVNIIAGQVKRAMGSDHSLGLPTICDSLDDLPGKRRYATLSNSGADVLMWVALIDSAS